MQLVEFGEPKSVTITSFTSGFFLLENKDRSKCQKKMVWGTCWVFKIFGFKKKKKAIPHWLSRPAILVSAWVTSFCKLCMATKRRTCSVIEAINAKTSVSNSPLCVQLPG